MRPVNLLPSDQRRHRATGARSGSAYVVVGVLAVLVAMVAGFILTSNSVNERKTQAAEARSEADQLEARANSLGPFSAFATVKEQRVTAVRTVADSRFDWERMMRELSRVIPAGSWLQTVDASVTGAPGDTSTASQSGTASGPPAAKVVGCARRQSDVAKAMVRMRALHKVNDVRLNESARGSGDSGGAGTCGSRVQFDVTVTFGANAAAEAPRGAKRVPASLGGGS